MKTLIRKFFPRSWLSIYHKFWSILACFIYNFPARKLKVIGITGTDGKSTTVKLTVSILEETGYKVGALSTIMFKVGPKEWLNKTRLTMLGRFGTQKFLHQLVKAGCEYAVIESSSEGLMQFRHWGINYEVAVITNITPEHLEAHGGFENYRAHKGRLFQTLRKTKKKNPQIKTTSIVNLDDENAEYFLKFEADEKFGYQKTNFPPARFAYERANYKLDNIIQAEDIQSRSMGIDFKVGDTNFHLELLGEFNVENALAAICVGKSQGIDMETIKKGLAKVKLIPGRLEKIDEGQNFKVIVDYAHTPGSFGKFFPLIKSLYPENNYIAVFGSAGGVRDVSKREKLGQIADKHCQKLIFTNEDPYDTPPEDILKGIASGIKSNKKENEDYWLIADRREAIQKAFAIAEPNDLVLILGKGTEPCIKIGHEKIPWDDRDVAREELTKINKK